MSEDVAQLSTIAKGVWNVLNDPLLTDPKQSTIHIQNLKTDGNQLLAILHQGKEIWTTAEALFEVKICIYLFEFPYDPVFAITDGLNRASRQHALNNNKLIVRLIVDQNPLSFMDDSEFSNITNWIRSGVLNTTNIDLQIVVWYHPLLDV
jgi:hypothetical protein